MNSKARYQPDDRIGGRFLVYKALMGGMGEVYLCLDLQQDEPFALKTFQQRYLTDVSRLRRAFEQEVITWVALGKHPNIVQCHILHMLDNRPFLALEWVTGEDGRGTDLRGWLRHGALDLRFALEIVIDICRGLTYAQARQPGLVHRDLKPENILIAQGGLAKITDFGLTQIVATAEVDFMYARVEVNPYQSFASRQGIVGTPAYMAPEQWRGELLDVRTDIYAVGVILYELLTGTLPFNVSLAPTTPAAIQLWLNAMQAAHEHDHIPDLPAHMPAALNLLLRSCLGKVRSDRPSDASELMTHLISLYTEHFGHAPPSRPAPGEFTAGDYNSHGISRYLLKQYAAALRDCERVIEIEPNFAPIYLNRGLIYHTLGDYSRALTDYGQALALYPNYAQVYSNQGLTYHALGKYQQALENFDQALQIDPHYANAYYNRGVTHGALGMNQAELDDYTRAIALDPHHVIAYYDRGVSYYDLGQYEAALADYDRALALDPNYVHAYGNRGRLYSELGRHELALADYDRALALDPNDATSFYNRGITYAALQQYELALTDCNRAIDLNPAYVKAYHNRGAVYINLQQDELAAADYSRIIELDPQYTPAYLILGIHRGRQGRHEEALAYLEQAAKLGDLQATQIIAQVRQALEGEPSTNSRPAE